MLWSTCTFVALLAVGQLAAAQTPSGFTPQVSESLRIKYGNMTIKKAGEMMEKKKTKKPPMISLKEKGVMPMGSKAVLMMLDLDAKMNGSETRMTKLHWMLKDVTMGNSSEGSGSSMDKMPGRGGNKTAVRYMAPNPPKGDKPHRYLFMLIEQPENFSVPMEYQKMKGRANFDYKDFMSATKLNKPIAANYIEVKQENKTKSGKDDKKNGNGTASDSVSVVYSGRIGAMSGAILTVFGVFLFL